MEWKEFELHSARKQLLKTTSHLIDARKALVATLQHNKGFAITNPTTLSVENNIHALIAGVNETIKFCGAAASELKNQMKEPDAVLQSERGGMGRYLTPKQRLLEMSGVVFSTMPKFIPTKREKKLKALNFTFKPTIRTKREKITKDNPPIC